MVQRRLDETAESERQANAAKAAAVSDRLKTFFLDAAEPSGGASSAGASAPAPLPRPQRKVMIVSYSLPVLLRRLPPAAGAGASAAPQWAAARRV